MSGKAKRTISDFFPPAASTVPKRARTATPRAATARAAKATSPTSPTTKPLQAARSIPLASKAIEVASGALFTPSDFLASLSSTPISQQSQLSELDLLTLEGETMDPSWLALLKDEVRKQYFIELKRFLWGEGLTTKEVVSNKVFPSASNVYSWSRYTPIEKVRVVILGQDPYHNDGQAHGLSFSVPPGVAIPPSLRNIYKQILLDYPSPSPFPSSSASGNPTFPPKHGNLIPLAKDGGVLWLNTSLTVRAHQAGSHSGKGWEKFTDKVVDLVDKFGGSGVDGEEGQGVVFLAWGAWAAKRVAKLDKTKHLILTSAHPSPLSAHRGFLGNGHFRKANDWLKEKYGDDAEVDWRMGG